MIMELSEFKEKEEQKQRGPALPPRTNSTGIPGEKGNFKIESPPLPPRTSRETGKFKSLKDLPDGWALVLFIAQLVVSFSVFILAACKLEANVSIKDRIIDVLKYCPIGFLMTMLVTFISCAVLYQVTFLVLHLASLFVIGFMFRNLAMFNSLSSTIIALIGFLFLGMFYLNGLPHFKLSERFIHGASRLCWRNKFLLMMVYLVYTAVLLFYLVIWSAGLLAIQHSRLYWKVWLCFGEIVSVMVGLSFLRDLLQIWLSRIVYFSNFVEYDLGDSDDVEVEINWTGRARKKSKTQIDSHFESVRSLSPAFDPRTRQLSKNSLFWTLGTAARSSFSLVSRAFEVHMWILTIVQIFWKVGPDTNPTCVLDVFHVPTAIYGSDYRESRQLVQETMVHHGMDKISVDLYFRSFTYYVFSYVNVLLALLALMGIFGSNVFPFRSDFVAASALAILNLGPEPANYVHFLTTFMTVATVLIVTSVDSVHMLLCWAICETPDSVRQQEPELMRILVTDYHASLDLERFTGFK